VVRICFLLALLHTCSCWHSHSHCCCLGRAPEDEAEEAEEEEEEEKAKEDGFDHFAAFELEFFAFNMSFFFPHILYTYVKDGLFMCTVDFLVIGQSKEMFLAPR
jgi:hypothetical protein